MSVQTFRSPAPPVDDPPIPFDLVVHREHKETDDEPRRYVEETLHFHAKPFVSGGLLAQVEIMSSRNPGEHARSGDAIYDFFYGALLPEDVKAFREVLEAPDIYVHSTVLSDLALWLYEKYTERPTNQA